MKFTILFALLPLLASAAPAEPQATQLGPSITYPQANEQALDSWAQTIKAGLNPNNMDAPPAVFAGKQIGHFYKRAIKETYYVDLFDKNYMWVNIEDTTAGTARWEHRQMLASGGPSYSSAAASSAVTTAAKSSSSSVSKSATSSATKSSSSSISKAASASSSVSKAAVSVSASSKAAVASSASSKAPVVSVSSSKPVVSSTSKAAAVVSSASSKAVVSSSVSKAPVSSSVSKAPASSTSKAAAVVSSVAPSSAATSSSAAPAATGGVSAADQTQFVTLHNDFRAKYTAGKVTWDDSLAAFALKTAQTCKYGHTGGPNGENIAAGVGGGYNIEKAFGSWANEDALYNFSKPGYSSATGHFTQIVWKATTKIGCAAASCADGTIFTGYRANSTYVVCEYQTPGNVVSSDPNRTAQIFTANVGPKA